MLHQTSQPVPPQAQPSHRARWISFGNDVRTLVREYAARGDLRVADVLDTYLKPKVYEIFAWDDPMPMVAHVAQSIRQRWRRLER